MFHLKPQFWEDIFIFILPEYHSKSIKLKNIEYSFLIVSGKSRTMIFFLIKKTIILCANEFQSNES